MDLSAKISEIAPRDSGVLVTYRRNSTYTIFFPTPGVDPQSFVQNNFPNSEALTGVGIEIKNGKEYLCHSFILYEIPQNHRPTNYQVWCLTWLTKIKNPNYELFGKSIKDLPFEIAGDSIAKKLLSLCTLLEQLKLIELMSQESKSFEELDDYFQEVVKEYKTWNGIREYLRSLGTEPSEEESAKYFS